jgi:uncharacterized membrane protein YbhN (UPF0104 family)
LLGLILTVLLVHRVGPHAMGAALFRVGPGFGWIVAAYAVATAVGAIPWALLIPRERRPSWTAVLSSRFAASGVNALLPFGGIGDAGRLRWMPRRSWSDATAAIIADRLLFVLASGLFLVGGVGSAFSLPRLPVALGVGGAAAAVLIIVGVVVMAVAAVRGQLIGRVARLLARVGLRRGGDKEPRETDPRDAALSRLLSGGPRHALAAALAVHLLSRLLLVAEIYAGLRLLGIPAGWRETLVFAAVPVGLSVLGPFVPGQLGMQEAVQAVVAAALGIGPATGLALVLLQRARQILFVPLSGLLIALAPGRAADIPANAASA